MTLKRMLPTKPILLGMLKRWGLVALFIGLLALIVQNRFVLDDDPIRSLRAQGGPAAELFDRYHEKSVFDGKVFLEVSALTEAEIAAIQAQMDAIGYTPTKLFQPPTPSQMTAFLPLLSLKELDAALSDEAIDARVSQALSLAVMPGGGAFLGQMEQDPFGLGMVFLKQMLGALGFSPATASTARILAYESPSATNYEAVGELYAALTALGDRVHFIGADFYAYESYRDAQRDIVLCTVLSTIVNLLLFLFFTRRLGPMFLLLVGSAVSYLSGVLLVGLFYERVFAVVLAFASTFVGFNNEYLVHLSALPQGSGKKSLLGVWSAVGTTLLGFVVLLLGQSVIVRQMALASLGGMAGFLVVLFIFRKQLGEIRYRTFTWPKAVIGKKALVGVAALALLAIALLPKPRIATDVKDFRTESPLLEAQERYFMGKLGESNLGQVMAIPIDGERLTEQVEALESAGRIDLRAHPLRAWRGIDEQTASIARLTSRASEALARLSAKLDEAGLALEFDAVRVTDLHPLTAFDFLEALNHLAPAKWVDEVRGQKFLFASAGKASLADSDSDRTIALTPMTPKAHFDEMLTGLSRELAILFAFGLFAMCVYLVVLHRRPLRVLYVFVPLLLIGAVFLALGWIGGDSQLTIIHFVGLALVIALATDYASVAMSVEHHEVELSKILITSLSTLGTFGVLLLARNPVIGVLGYTVTLACLVAAPFALFVMLPKEKKEEAVAAASEGASGADAEHDTKESAA
ncbi:MAG: hypothetical protein LBM75_05640 [Myxococcales bacterium]|jgi:predicted exporter|nr:hypothetical protein [Myxococcales bacterium]